MGKGDRRTRRGKIWRKTHGKKRPASEEGRRRRGRVGAAGPEGPPPTGRRGARTPT